MKALWIAALLLWPAAFTAQQPERRTLAGDHVAIYNLAGVMRLERGTGSDVVVELTRGGRDAGKLQIATGPIRGRETLRIIYPDDEIVYRELGHGSNTTLRVRDDGTFNDRDDRGRCWSDDGRRVRISGSGGGLEAHADARIAIPAGKRVELYLAVGQAFPSTVDGDLRIDVAAANVTVDDARRRPGARRGHGVRRGHDQRPRGPGCRGGHRNGQRRHRPAERHRPHDAARAGPPHGRNRRRQGTDPDRDGLRGRPSRADQVALSPRAPPRAPVARLP